MIYICLVSNLPANKSSAARATPSLGPDCPSEPQRAKLNLNLLTNSLNKFFPSIHFCGFLIVCYIHLVFQYRPLRKRYLLHPDPVSPRLTYIQARRKGSSLNYILADPSATFIGPLCLKSLKLRPKIIVLVIY